MKIKVELFGASREFSKNNLIEFEIKNNATIKDIRDEMINYLEINTILFLLFHKLLIIYQPLNY